ncbi:acyl-CoA thioesterase [Candidatus Palauibacter sp.]|uniref:acyl-CoA thioesterase n=1 Tax=Candidatus Palauibacter sp. TaxID=3101350 RepID=UPI003AF27986
MDESATGSQVDAFEIEIAVRTYELDMLGHVNNAVYLNWLEQGRLSAMERCGYSVRSLARDWLTNIVRAEVDFRSPTLYGDRLIVTTALARVGRTSFSLASEILRLPEREIVAEALAVLVWLDGDGRPTPLPADFEARWKASLSGVCERKPPTERA